MPVDDCDCDDCTRERQEAEESKPQEPTPIPIKLIYDTAKPAKQQPKDEKRKGKKNKKDDYFYPAWESFLSGQSNCSTRSSHHVRELEAEKEKITQEQPDGLRIEENAASSWEQAATACTAKVTAIAQECRRLNQKYRDAIFDLEENEFCLKNLAGDLPESVRSYFKPPWIKRVEDIYEDPQFIINGDNPADIHQGYTGDCWFLAALIAVSAKRELIDRLCVARDEQVGVYGFVFFRDGEWIYEVVDDKLYVRVGDLDELTVVRDWNPMLKKGTSLAHDHERLRTQLQTGGEALYFSHCKTNETWLPLIEKAYAKAHGDYHAIEGGWGSEGIEDLTGGVAVLIRPEDIMDKGRFWEEQLSQVNSKYLFGGGTHYNNNKEYKGLAASHEYAVLEVFEEDDLRLVKIRNPWGDSEWNGDWSDGSRMWTGELMTKLNHTFGDDGIFWMAYEVSISPHDYDASRNHMLIVQDFMKHFPTINRVRLFDNTWNVSQRWTCVSVPWTVDYLDTKFHLTVSDQGPLVVVLSQPDERYFRGLAGRYLFALHFRLYRAGDEDGERYLVRSMNKSGDEIEYTRSVSAELEDVEPGNYTVIVKVTATRDEDYDTAQDTILDHAIERKEKLLTVGRRFDYAQTKGNLRAMEKSLRKDERQANKAAYHARERVKRWKKMKEREMAQLREQRIERAREDNERDIKDKIMKYQEKRLLKKLSERKGTQQEKLGEEVLKVLGEEKKRVVPKRSSRGGEDESEDASGTSGSSASQSPDSSLASQSPDVPARKNSAAFSQQPDPPLIGHRANGTHQGSVDFAVDTISAGLKRMGIRSPQSLISPGSQISPRTVRPNRAKDLSSGLAKLDTEYKKEQKRREDGTEKSWSIPSSDSEVDAALTDAKVLQKYIKAATDDFEDDDFEWDSEM